MKNLQKVRVLTEISSLGVSKQHLQIKNVLGQLIIYRRSKNLHPYSLFESSLKTFA